MCLCELKIANQVAKYRIQERTASRRVQRRDAAPSRWVPIKRGFHWLQRVFLKHVHPEGALKG